MNIHTSICYSWCVVGLIFLTTINLIISSIRFRGKGRWSPSIHGSLIYHIRKVHRYDVVEKSLQRRYQTLKPGSQTRLLRHSPHKCCSTMVEKRDRGIQTSCYLRRESAMGYDSGSAPVLRDGSFFAGFVTGLLVHLLLNNCPPYSRLRSSSIGPSSQTRRPEEWAGVGVNTSESWWLHRASYRAPYVTRNL